MNRTFSPVGLLQLKKAYVAEKFCLIDFYVLCKLLTNPANVQYSQRVKLELHVPCFR